MRVDPKTGKSELCLSTLASIIEMKDGSLGTHIQANPPTNNEAYLGTAIMSLIMEFREQGSKGKTDALSWLPSAEKKRQLLDAIERFHPNRLDQLALAYDKVSNSDLGSRWYRQYFWKDPTNGKQVLHLSDFEKDSHCLLLSKSQESLFLTPLQHQQNSDETEKSISNFAKTLPYSEFKTTVNTRAKELLTQWRELRTRITPASRVAISKLGLAFPSLCKKGLESPQIRKIQSWLEHQNVVVGTSELSDLIRVQCPSFATSKYDQLSTPDYWWDDYLQMIARVNELRDRVNRFKTTPTIDEYTALIKDWDDIKSQGNYSTLWLKMYTLVSTLDAKSISRL